MTRKLIAIATTTLILVGAIVGVQKYISSQIISRFEIALPKASGFSASVPLKDLPSNLASDSIKAVQISVKSFPLKESNQHSSLDISALNINKSKLSLVGSLEITATIPVSTITNSPEFSGAQIVGNTLHVSTGVGGFGTAILIPRHSNSQIFFELQSVSIFGSEIPATSLPADLKNQIKSKSQRNITPPKGLKIKSVLLNPKGLSVKMFGKNVQLSNLGTDL